MMFPLRVRRLALLALVVGTISRPVIAGPPELDFLKQHCVQCHGAEEAESDLRLDTVTGLSDENEREQWHAIWRKVSDQEMPPEDAPQPEPDARKSFLARITEAYGFVRQEAHWAFQPVVRPAVPASDTLNPIDAFVAARLKEHQLERSSAADRRTLIRRVTLDLTGLPPTPAETRAFVNDTDQLDDAFQRVVDRLLSSPRYGERWAQHWLDVIRWAETVGFETNLERPNAWHYRDWVINALNEDMPYDQFVFEQIAGDTRQVDAALGFLVAGPANLPGQIGRDEEAMRQARQDELDEVIRTVSQSLFGLTIGCARCHDHKFDPITQRDYYSMQAIFAGLSYGDRRLRGPQNDQWTKQLPEVQHKLDALKLTLEQTRRDHQLRQPLNAVHSESLEPVRVDAVRMEIAAADNGTASLYEFEVWTAPREDSPSVNVALASAGATPSASSFALANQTRHFDNLVDGTVDKRQAFPWVAAEGGPAWLQIDLPTASTIDRVVWHAGSSTPASYEIKGRDPETRAWKTLADTHDRLPRVSDSRAAKDVQIRGMSSEQIEALVVLLREIRATQSELTRLANGPQAYAASFHSAPEPTWLLARGDPLQRVSEVVPSVPAVLKSDISAPRGEREVDRRLVLANHLTRPDHPLTARVIVNRIWQHHFGSGLVQTPSDFGMMGARPSHPKLLDWLAAEFVEQGWSLKKLHRLIVSSRTYQQSSLPQERGLGMDAESRLLWRYPPRRIDAETIRDSILSVSGKLNPVMYGPGFDFFDRRGGLSDYTAKETFDPQGWRRMIYAHKIRMQSVDIFGAFDCPDAGQMTPQRNTSITPIQSLGLFNSPFANRQAAFFAERIRNEAPGEMASQIDYAFEVALARLPSKTERTRMIELALGHGLEQVCRVLLNSSEFVFLH